MVSSKYQNFCKSVGSKNTLTTSLVGRLQFITSVKVTSVLSRFSSLVHCVRPSSSPPQGRVKRTVDYSVGLERREVVTRLGRLIRRPVSYDYVNLFDESLLNSEWVYQTCVILFFVISETDLVLYLDV